MTNFFNIFDSRGDATRKLAEGMEAEIFVGEHAMLSLVRLDPHAEGAIHSHPEEQWGILLEGSGTRIQDGVAHPVKKGDFWRTPGNVPHGFTAGPEGATVMDMFSPPRAAYRTSGAGFSA